MDKILEEIPVELNKASTVYKQYGMNVLSHSLQYNTIQYNTIQYNFILLRQPHTTKAGFQVGRR